MDSRLAFPLGLVALLLALSAHADGPKDNHPEQVRPVPPVGLELSSADRSHLASGLAELNEKLQQIRSDAEPRHKSLLPDVEIFARAIRDAVRHRELFSKRDVANSKQVLEEGLRRADALLEGKAPWLVQKGLVVRGFRSRIDGTVQPYGLVIPPSYEGRGKSDYRLDLWFHGRGERMSESVFIADRMHNVGRYAPRDTIVLHPYGRYSNAFKFAGEIDVLESMEHAKRYYRIDEDRISVRGFSMGGAGCWQMAVHYPDLFFAANPGAGFSETPDFLGFFQKETLNPTWYEQKLWQMYDCNGYAVNLFQLPTIAYSGELDIQKQAADIMESALAEEGMRLTHIIGPQTKHTIHKDSMVLIESKLQRLARRGRPNLPRELRYVTYSLKYNRVYWLTLTELGEHWAPARVEASILGRKNRIRLKVSNVKGLEISLPAGLSPFAADKVVALEVSSGDGEPQVLEVGHPGTDLSFDTAIHLTESGWKTGPRPEEGLAKRHNLQGPIDDAFMDSFLLVKPSKDANHAAVAEWSEAELGRMVREWRRQFRGDARIKQDTDVDEADIASHHLVLFGDPASNQVLKRIAKRLPVQWSNKEVVVGDKHYDATTHAPILIYPNPLNPDRYVVLNSGFTYREYAYLNNARQVSKLPDWAVVDLRQPPDTLWPGRIVDAGFFDERWQLK